MLSVTLEILFFNNHCGQLLITIVSFYNELDVESMNELHLKTVVGS